MKTVWDKKWEKLSKSAIKSTMLNAFSRPVYSSLFKFIGSDKPLKILDVGCGTGRFCFALANDFPSSRICGVDISKASIDLCERAKFERKARNVDFRMMDVNDLKFRDGEFDIVFSEGVLPLYKNDLLPMKEMGRVTKKRGKVIVSVANWYCFPHTIYKALKGDRYEYGYERSYKHREIRSLFENAGLANIEILGTDPSYGVRRIKGHPLLGGLVTRLIDLTGFIFDRSLNNCFSNRFGFQLIVKGVK